MRNIVRNPSYLGYENGYDSFLEQLSDYCFISDISCKRQIYHIGKQKVYEKTFLLDEKLCLSLEKGIIRETDIVFFQESTSLKEYSFYLDTKSGVTSIGSNTKRGQLTIDLINRTLNRRFADTIVDVHNKTKEEIDKLYEQKEQLKKEEIDINKYISFVKEVRELLKNSTDSELISVRATETLKSDKYKNIKKFIFDHPCIRERTGLQEEIRKEIDFYESVLKDNLLLNGIFYYEKLIGSDLPSYQYREAIEKLKKESVDRRILQLLEYADYLFNNFPDQFNWEIQFPLLNKIKVKENLLIGYENFISIIGEEQHVYLELKRKLSKAEAYLKKDKYSEFIVSIQKFFEEYLKVVNPCKSRKYQHLRKKIATELSYCKSSSPGTIRHEIIEIIHILFNNNDSDQPNTIDKVRNSSCHGDIGLSKETYLKSPLRFLTEKEIDGSGEYFRKLLKWFYLPEQNIFDQINQEILRLLVNPDLLSE